jgi:hypothetical protein
VTAQQTTTSTKMATTTVRRTDGATDDNDDQEVMTTSTTSDPSTPHNNKPFGRGEGGPFRQGERGGEATVDANIRGRDGDAANKEKIRTTATEKEGGGRRGGRPFPMVARE